MSKILCDAIKQCHPQYSDMIDLFSTELSIACFGYGEQHAFVNNKKSIYNILKSMASNSKRTLIELQSDLRYKINHKKPPIVSILEYFNIQGIINDFNRQGIEVKNVPWVRSGIDNNIYQCHKHIQSVINKWSTAQLIDETFFELVDSFQSLLNKYYSDISIKGLIVPFDCYSIQKMAINAASLNKKTSLVFLHGIPQYYSAFDNLRGDYLAVWGENIKKEYIRIGANAKKIIVVGHPIYSGLKVKEKPRFSFERVVVLTQSIPGGLSTGQTDTPRRDGCMAYPWIVESVLKKLNVKSAKLRPHPGEYREWYHKVIKNDFYSFDTDTIDISMQKSTLVIGPSSTVWLNAYKAGVHYQVFEPTQENGKNIIGFDLAPPFDGNDSRLHVTKNAQQLYEALLKKIFTDTAIFSDWTGEAYEPTKILKLFLD